MYIPLLEHNPIGVHKVEHKEHDAKDEQRSSQHTHDLPNARSRAVELLRFTDASRQRQGGRTGKGSQPWSAVVR